MMQRDHSASLFSPTSLGLKLIGWRYYLSAATTVYPLIKNSAAFDLGLWLFMSGLFGAIAWLLAWVGNGLIKRKSEAHRTAVILETRRIIGWLWNISWFGLID
ncbi:MAG: hypothetical protein LCH85_13035 [Chloroflexi bacterium]|nr:hypothetical protein [Chloroflexota bacterium]